MENFIYVMETETKIVLIVLGSGLILSIFVFVLLTLKNKRREDKRKEEEHLMETKEEYEELKGTEPPEREIEESILDMMLKYHKKELLHKVDVKTIDDLDYVILTHLNDMMKNTYFEQYPFWSILHPKEAKHSLLMLKNVLENAPDEEYYRVRDVIFAWLNYVFDLDGEIVEGRDYIKKEDLIKIIDEVLNKV